MLCFWNFITYTSLTKEVDWWRQFFVCKIQQLCEPMIMSPIVTTFIGVPVIQTFTFYLYIRTWKVHNQRINMHWKKNNVIVDQTTGMVTWRPLLGDSRFNVRQQIKADVLLYTWNFIWLYWFCNEKYCFQFRLKLIA